MTGIFPPNRLQQSTTGGVVRMPWISENFSEHRLVVKVRDLGSQHMMGYSRWEIHTLAWSVRVAKSLGSIQISGGGLHVE